MIEPSDDFVDDTKGSENKTDSADRTPPVNDLSAKTSESKGSVSETFKTVRYHYSDVGPRRCDARVRECPIGGDHYQSREEAQKAFERSNGDRTVPSLSKTVSRQKPVEGSGKVVTWGQIERKLRADRDMTIKSFMDATSVQEHEAQKMFQMVQVDKIPAIERGIAVSRYINDRMYSSPALVLGEQSVHDRLIELEQLEVGDQVVLSAFDRDRECVMKLGERDDLVVFTEGAASGDGTVDYIVCKVDPKTKNNTFGDEPKMLIDPEIGSVIGSATMVVEWPEDAEQQETLLNNGAEYVRSFGRNLVSVRDLSLYKTPVLVEVDTGLVVNAKEVYVVPTDKIPVDREELEAIYMSDSSVADFAYSSGFKLFGRCQG